jgi:hypothetical protein
VFSAEKTAAADEILGDGKFAPGYKRVHWMGCTHGFAVCPSPPVISPQSDDWPHALIPAHRFAAILYAYTQYDCNGMAELTQVLQTIDAVRKGKEGAFKEAVEWFHKL